ncbi:SUMO-specific isopeptidase USPL1 [Hippocampus zosterae]|uniref:SUMO-specific isopeptidase USPL1 n=1 Tax=Hippocampus zosterae TaxID=109293 RepID=UPI00223DB6C1|nr:SUMO-specific isopeptidase USPL1 [Hippocampus zosterae]XP_051903037.1 SUMO-specific isopeptidase USPL1 [Hippocampus zosterae]
MVILPEWRRASAADLGRSGAEVMPGEDAGSGARASPPVGYLGKVQERAASLECCPWCASKGLRSPLRLCRLNLHESVTLCTEPQCLFPLVSRPLDDILASLAPAETTTTAGGRKRKASSWTENQSDCQEVKVRCLRSGQADTPPPSPLPSGHHETAVTHVEPSDGVSRPPRDRLSHQGAAGNAEENADFSATPPTDGDDASGRFASAAEGPVASPEEPVDASLGTAPEQTMEIPDKSIILDPFGVPAAPLFWKNAHELCWLDVLLVVLVNCESLRRRQGRREPRRAAVWRLMSGYDRACDTLRAGSGEQARVRRDADERLQSLRTAVLESLRPQLLRCRLGQKESPVLAMPLLLAADSWAEPLFRTTFRWEFECAQCKTVTRERVSETLPTLTNVLPDWHPMRATHWAVCDACGAQRQRRSMKLERVAAVLALHFAEGAPHGDPDALAFALGGRRYAVTAIVQYERRAEHFVAWTRTPGGFWREFDDLKHPQSPLHPTPPVPAQEMQLVFWEAQEASPGSGACSPSSTRPDSPPSLCGVPDRHLAREEEEEEESAATSAEACGNVSISSVTLLDAFHGLSHDDIVTLTLTEVAADAPTDHAALLDDVLAPDSSSQTPEDPGESPQRSAESNADNDAAWEEAPTRLSKAKHQRGGRTAKTKASPQGAAAQASGPPADAVGLASPASSTGGPPSPPRERTSPWSLLLSHHLANQRPNGATPTPAQRPPAHSTPAPKPRLLPMEDGDGHPLKAAEAFGAFGGAVQRLPAFSKSGGRCHQIQAGSPAPVLSDTEALRYKLLKKLKAKKKKLAKLDRLLARRPDKAAPISPDGFLPPDPPPLPSPSAAVSPDSSGFLDALVCRQDATPDAPQPPMHTENFLDEFFSMTPVAAQQTMEDETLRELELLLS